ncbi:MAG: aminopeptidase [Lachnospiraceae bacterium]|nr:aminopeptidase [Lachnospiraceae bacterium]
MAQKNSWEFYTESDLQEVEKLSSSYQDFLNRGKTERECVSYIEDWAEKHGFRKLSDRIAERSPLKAGERLIATHMGKTAALYIIGKNALEHGLNYVGAHIDSPRIDLKQNPVYEDMGMAYFDTHYYGGVKKYQWVTLPLAIHGVVALKDGSVVPVVIGEEEGDPVVGITDLLIHLSQEQMEKAAAKVIEGESLDILIASRPSAKKDGEEAAKEPVKTYVLSLLKEKYGIEEDDFISAELEAVPAGKARDFGLDRSMIMAYGHDDRCCAYPALYAMEQMLADLDQGGDAPEKTCLAFFADKEEIGSVGATGSHSHFFENTVAELCALDDAAQKLPLELVIRRCLQNTCVLSADVSSGFDPLYASAFAKNNCARIGYGISIVKYTGARGKSSANDANAEYLAQIRRILDAEHVNFQTSELGRVDLGGGGTIAYIIAAYGAQVVDCGIPVLSMHAPWEVISKADLYEAYRAYLAFYKNM